MRFLLPSLLSSFVILAVACGDEPASGAAAQSRPVSAADFPARYVETYCRTLAPCCTGEAVPYDEAYCRDREALGDKFVGLTQIPELIVYDPAGAGRCLDAMVAAGCKVKDDVDTPGCEGIFVGQIPLGGSCQDSLFCAPQAGKVVRCTGQKFEDGPGTCTIVTENVGVGGECRGAGDTECAPNLACSFVEGAGADAKGTCQPRPKVGEACTYDCDETARCSSAGKGVCEPLIALGQACAGDFVCVAGAFCDNFDGKICKPLRKRGEACGIGFQCMSGLCQGDKCRDTDVHECSADVDGGSAPIAAGGAGGKGN